MKPEILKNSSYLIFAQGATKVISFVYTIFLARSLGVENFGLFTLALSYFALISAISDLGLSRYLYREISIDENKSSTLLPAAFLIRAVITTYIFAAFALLLPVFDNSKIRVGLILLAVLATLPQTLALTLDNFFVARRKLFFSAVGILLVSVTTALIGTLFLIKGVGVLAPLLALIFGQLISVFILTYFLFKQKIHLSYKVSVQSLTQIIKGSLPYGIVVILGIFYFKIDTLLLSYFKGAYDTGIYGAAYKFLEAIIFIPSAIALALFPVLAKLSLTNQKEVYRIYSKALRFNLLISLLVAVLYFFVLPLFIEQFLPQFIKAIEVIKILTITIPLVFMISIQSIILFSQKKYLTALIVISVFNLVLNIILNVILIPKYSYIGSAWTTVVSDLIGFLIFYFFIKLQYER